MPDQDIFDKDNPPVVADPASQVTPPAPDLFSDQLSSIKNADGTPKYDSVPKALDALAQSQLHIKKLEAEAATSSEALTGLREKVAKNDVVEDVMARIAAQDTGQQVQATPQPNVVDEEAVLSLVRTALNADRSELKSKENVATVQKAIMAKYGDKAAEVMADKARELGTSLDHLKKLSSESPALVVALFTAGKSPVDNPTSTSISLGSPPGEPTPLDKPKKSLLAGATSKEQKAFMDKVREEVYAKHNVET